MLNIWEVFQLSTSFRYTHAYAPVLIYQSSHQTLTELFFAASYLLLQPTAQATWDDKNSLWSRICTGSPGPCCCLPWSPSDRPHARALTSLSEHPWASQTSFNCAQPTDQKGHHLKSWLNITKLKCNWDCLIWSNFDHSCHNPTLVWQKSIPSSPLPIYYTGRYHDKNKLLFIFLSIKSTFRLRKIFYLCLKDYIPFDFKSIRWNY